MNAGEETTAPTKWLPRLLRGWVRWVQQHPRSVLAVSAALAVGALVLAGTRLTFKTSRSDLIDPKSAYYQDLKQCETLFGAEDDIIVVVEGDRKASLISAIETVAREIQGYPDHFQRLFHRIPLDRLKAKGLFQLSTEEVQRIGGQIDSLAPVLAGGWDLLTVENLLRMTNLRLTLAGPAPTLDDQTAEMVDNAGAVLESLSFWLTSAETFRSSWRKLMPTRFESAAATSEYFFSTDGKLAFLRVAPKRDTSSFTGLDKPVQLMRQIVQRVGPAFPDVQFGLTGISVLEQDEMQISQSASTVSLIVSIIGVSAMFLLFFRAWRHPLFALAALGISGCWTIGWVALTVGHLNILSAAFIVTLVGMGIGYGILWLAQYESLRGSQHSREDANERTAWRTAPGIVVGALTSLGGFFATMTTNFLGLVEMGFIGGSGIIICMIGTFTVLPAMLQLWGTTTFEPVRQPRDHWPAFPPLSRRPRLAAAVGIAVGAAFAAFLPWIRLDFNLLNLQPEGLEAVRWEKELITRTGSSAWYALSVADSEEAARERRRQFSQLPGVGKVVELASLLPTDQAAKQPIIARIQSSLSALPESLPPRASADAMTLAAQMEALANRTAALPAVQRLVQAARSAKAALEARAPVSRNELLARFETRWLDDLVRQLSQLRGAATPEPVTLADLPAPLVERYHSADGHWLLQIFPARDVWDLPPLQEFAQNLATVDAHVTGLPISTLRSLENMYAGYVSSTIIALVIITLFIAVEMRSVGGTLLALLPLALGCLVMFGSMGLLNVPFNPANLIALPLILGIGVDFGIHVLHDARHSPRPYFLSWRICRAVLLIGLTTIISFASMLGASHQGLATIGLVLSIGVTACLGFSLTVLPAILQILDQRTSAITTSTDEEPGARPIRQAV